jgi:hypothetical protein
VVALILLQMREPLQAPGSSGAPGDGRITLEAAKEREKRRLEQNRAAAKRFRAKKKGHLAQLEATVASLRRENEALQARLAGAAAGQGASQEDTLGVGAGAGTVGAGAVQPPAILQVLPRGFPVT